ncbi:HAMP domain-containing histidine kinase [Pedobacter sp. SD-b]|uniref:histidine kinase n=1 Tax=Pedobacter segetis TaxID=2793069 RepID=A0ABS1BF58_9SPHI|nr:HAMP domain-containing sensor histidine kinase [Pedobacter segetis]MBK0381492.1 HAMP domain-containing histidine kinase [Pedobacter segetis]
MKTATKIRWLLLLVTIGLFATSLTARWASTKLVDLNDVAIDINSDLNQKETKISNYLSHEENLKSLEKLHLNANLATKVLNRFTGQNIFFQTYVNKKLVFWSDISISANNVDNYKEGSSFVAYKNGWYEAIKRSENNFFVVFFIPIKSHVPYNNQYINDADNQFLINNPTIEIASLTDKDVVDIKNLNGRYLFSIMKSNRVSEIPYNKIEVMMWCCGLVTLLFLLNSICKYYADDGYPILATIVLGLFFCLIRYLGLKYHFPNAIYSLAYFDPKIYASSFYFPSFADLIINVFAFLWLIIFFYSYRDKAFKPIKSPWLGYPTLLYGAIFIIFVSYKFSDVFFGLVFNSTINLNVSNLVNLNLLSFLGVMVLIGGLLIYYLLLDLLVYLSSFVEIPFKFKLALFFVSFAAYTCYGFLHRDYSIFCPLIFVLIFIIGRVVYTNKGKIVFPALVLITFIFATIVSVKLSVFEGYKELEVRKTLLQKLENASDSYALMAFGELETKITKERILLNDLRANRADNKQLITLIGNKYLSGYLNKFNFKAYLFNKDDSLISQNINQKIQVFKKLVENKSNKVTKYFYKKNNTFGTQNYFAIIPLKADSNASGTLILDLKSKTLERYGAFPHILQNGVINPQSEFLNYSYAFYQNKKLLNQFGSFVYDNFNTEYNGETKQFIVLKKGDVDHLIYKPSTNQTIVITHVTSTFWIELAALSFFFIIFLCFGIVLISYRWILQSLFSYKISFKNLRIKILASNNRILYKTRIQIALVLAVVSSLLIIGIITFSYISIQYTEQQEDFLKSKIKVISSAFEDNTLPDINPINNAKGAITFDDFSKMYNSDLNLFDVNGMLLFSTQNKLYSTGIIAERMNPLAFINLNIKKKSEFIQQESIRSLKFTSAYVPIKNADNNIIAYLQLPYFANQDDYNQKIGTFLNLLINIYVLVFVAIAFFAFVVANQITSPLSLIQESISKTVIGKKNNPIKWKRNDEIGSLISEYNAMIATLEENANKLAQSERETAWREMAKQVAHEIKNPLTPLRLGIQMLDRSWKDKDEKFDEKFKKFSKSFLEQIDSLSRIASEFSNFAKMPELKLEKVKVLDVLNRAIEVYSQMGHIKIICDEPSLEKCLVLVDKDQLLRSFNNLLKNAIEAMPEEQEGIIEIKGERTQHSIKIAISDNGNGIPLNSRENIFVPNFTTKSSGTGLGLAFVKQAVENVKGNIYFTTEINVGTTFYITLPLVNK